MFNKFFNLDQLLSSSWFLKTVSLLVALLLWIYVTGDRNAELTRTLTCPVQFLGLATQISLKTNVEDVEVQLSGERSIITGLDAQKVACEINLSGLEPGKYRLAVRTTVPRDLKLVNVTPSHLDIELVRIIERIFPVSIEVKGGLPSGLFLDRVDIDPQNVIVKGEEHVIKAIQKIRVEPTLEQLKAGGRIELPLLVQTEGEVYGNYSINPEIAGLRAVLAQGLPKREVPVKVDLVGEPLPDYTVAQILVEPANVKIEGPQKQIDDIGSLSTQMIDISAISKDQQFVVPLILPQNGGVKFAENNSVRVMVKLKPYTVTKMISRVPVSVQGTSVYPSWSVNPSYVDITLEGTPSSLRILESHDVLQAYVNVTNIVSKKLTVPVLINLNVPDLVIKKVDPSNVSVQAELD
ncbi:MAG: hypothetical protein JW971_06500 [Synergistales bacterium]|nr:hypothetical protein [Synergistales bacterium]